jgi:hypothetical protein
MITTSDVKVEGRAIEQFNSGFLIPDSFERAMNIADLIANSSFCPLAMRGKPGDVLIAMQMGMELGLKIMQAVQNIAVINGRATVWGDAIPAICRRCPDWEWMKEEYLPDVNGYICRMKRRDEPEFSYVYTEADAILAGLWNKDMYKKNPKRMLQMRARGFCARDTYPDMLRGMYTAEEMYDGTVSIENNNVGNTYSAEVPISSNVTDSFRRMIEEAGADEAKICEYLKIDSLESIPPFKVEGLHKMLEKKILKARKTEKLPVVELKEPEVAEVQEEQEVDPVKEYFGEE